MSEKNDLPIDQRDPSNATALSQQPQRVRKRLLRHILSEIQVDVFAEIELLLLTLCTGE